MSKFSMEAFLEINYELVFKIDSNRKLPSFGFFETTRSVGAKPQKGVQILLQIMKPLSDTEILTPELVGDQIEMLA